MPVSRYTPPNGGYYIEVIARTRHAQDFASGMGTSDAQRNLHDTIAAFFAADIFALEPISTLINNSEVRVDYKGYGVGQETGSSSTDVTVHSRYIFSPDEERQSVKAGIEMKGAGTTRAVEEVLYKRAVALEGILIDGVKFRAFLGR